MDAKKIYKTTEGIVQTVTNNSLKVNGKWYKCFDLRLLEGISKDHHVLINYNENIKDGKTYFNVKSIIIKLTCDEPMKAIPCNPEAIVKKCQLDTSTFNTILMISKDIYLTKYSNVVTYEDCVKEVLKGMKLINA